MPTASRAATRSRATRATNGPATACEAREHTPEFRWGRGASIGTVALAAVATAIVGIASAISGGPPTQRKASVGATTSAQAASFGRAAKSLTAALGVVEHEARSGSTARHGATVRRPRHKTRHRAHTASKRSGAAARRSRRPTAPTQTPSSAPRPSYSSSSSTAASSSQPATSTAAAATSSNTSHQSQPAFGQNGSLGPGRGAPGTQ